MAFNVQRLVLASTGANAGMQATTDTAGNSLIINGPQLWTYESATDALATIAAANYFSEKAFAMSVGDFIMATGTDASNMYIVATVDTSVVPNTITVDSFTASGSVATANIQDLAVTTAKLAADAVTNAKLADDAVETANIVDANVTSAKLAADVLQYVAVPITAAEFNGMYAAPVELVAAAGADTLLVLDRVVLAMTYGSAAYAAGGVAHVQYDDTANGAGVIASTTLAAASFQDTASTVYSFNAGVVEYPFATCANTGLFLSNITGAFTTGDSDMVAHVWYKAIPTV